MTKIVTIIISATTDVAASAVARRIVNTMDNVVAWANTNHAGLVDGVTARTQDVTVVQTKAEFEKVGGVLVVKVQPLGLK